VGSGGTGLESCPLVGFGISGVEASVSNIRELVVRNSYSWYRV